jgi:aspartate aminotransferase
MFERLDMAPPDAIMGLNEVFKQDPNPRKINLTVGVYKDAAGKTPVLNTVRQAQERIQQAETTKNYLPIEGSPEYGSLVRALLFGPEHEILHSRRAVTAQAPGGTGALRVAGDFVKRMFPEARIWISEPTWPNHPGVFQAAGLEIGTYPYFDAQRHDVAIDDMLAALRALPEGDIVVLHGCCHNPTGVDLAPDQWEKVADVVAERRLLPLVDFAYQGFAQGLDEDAVGLRILARTGQELLVASSFSKNFGLYNERVGALTAVAADADAAEKTLSHIKRCVRANYSNPPAHGGAIVQTVLSDPGLRAEWQEEVKEMRDRINSTRHLFVETLNEQGVRQDFSFITRQRGMFSFSGLNAEQVKLLREKYSIYMVGSGRMNVAGMTEENMDYLCRSIAEVLE